ncbi:MULTISPECIES: IS21 family transposase [Sporomusa]|uniref:IS21 family transposase n=1 Tax=Sporomusa TaxID=2375 RepID=UPI0016664BC3|nr:MULTISPECIES: IS21 family transposase [Sporomusa]HML32312.1 IS21 family transposase [Sporomusa sphaeroides]
MTQYREILRLNSLGINQTGIAGSCGCSRKTVRNVLKRAKDLDIAWPLKAKTTDVDLEKMFFPNKSVPEPARKYPDYEYIDKEIKRNGVTLKLLWNEYCEECRQCNELPLMYSQFCFHYQKYAEKKRATMHIPRKPGEQSEVDWAGDPAHIVDRDTGEMIPCYVFVGVLNYSLYAYVEAFLSMDMESWITAHVHMYHFFGGSTRMLIPDNLKTGVDRCDWFTPKINKTYHEMAEHYDTAVIPARVKAPKDKPGVEGTVGVISTWITAALRNEKFFSLAELNREIYSRLEAFNRRPFQKKEGSRYSVYLTDEKPFLTPLPSAPYELAQWKQATVQFNYHISVDKMQYSVPCEYIKQKVDVRLTRNVVEVFYNNNRISSHRRLYGHPGQYSTLEAHMPEDHQKYLKWDGERFIAWAEKIGTSTTITIKSILASYKVQQQGYKACMGLLKLADKYSVGRLEAACQKALSYTPHPSYKSVKNILATGQDKVAPDEPSSKADPSAAHGYIRGAGYYGGRQV